MATDGAEPLWALHRRYLANLPPAEGDSASVGYRMRTLSLRLLEDWDKLRLARERPELGLDGTKNATERAIGKSRIRQKTMRGYKGLAAMINGITLTQHLCAGHDEIDLTAVLAA